MAEVRPGYGRNLTSDQFESGAFLPGVISTVQEFMITYPGGEVGQASLGPGTLVITPRAQRALSGYSAGGLPQL